MKRFQQGQRVLVLRAGQGDGVEIRGYGNVTRLRYCDDGAWVDLDRRCPGYCHAFPEDDPHGRGTHVLTWPEWCEEADSGKDLG